MSTYVEMVRPLPNRRRGGKLVTRRRTNGEPRKAGEGSAEKADTCHKDAVLAWLLEGDPAIRWQAMRDLAGASPRAIERERKKIATEGWGARLLARQAADGRWAATARAAGGARRVRAGEAKRSSDGGSPDVGLYTPKWISTTYTMLVLRDFGLTPGDARAKKACALLLDRGLQADGGVSYGTWAQWTHAGETCISGMVLSILAYFEFEDPRLETIVAHLLDEQMPDGGWNCRRPHGATHSSVHTTISVLEGMRFYELLGRAKSRHAKEAQRRGREFLLRHRLFRSHRTGRVIKPEFLRLSFPPRWHYDILRALDYFRWVNAPRDPRLGEAVEILRSKRRADGRWPLQNAYRGRVYFEMERVGAPSRWNTLRALRVLKWWDGGP
jgi:hypothetical protein